MVAAGGHAWLLPGGACVVAPGGGWHVWDMTRYGDTINERAVRILLECILVTNYGDVVHLFRRIFPLADYATP